MQAGIAMGRVPAASLLLFALLICASCNLSAMPEDASTRFEGPPVIHIAAPQPNQTYLAGTKVIVQARVENAGPDLARVAVLLDEALLGEKLAPNETQAAILPLTIDWTPSKAGQYNISVVAERGDGSADRKDVTIEVALRQRPDSTAPTDAAIEAAGDTRELPVETGAPPTVDEGVNLLVTNIELDPALPVCGQATTIRAIVRNSGSLDSQTSPWVSAKAHLLSDQSVLAENAETTYLPKLKAGEETVLDMSITINSNYNQRQQIRVTLDAGNHILETDESDNTGNSQEFELSRGNCP